MAGIAEPNKSVKGTRRPLRGLGFVILSGSVVALVVCERRAPYLYVRLTVAVFLGLQKNMFNLTCPYCGKNNIRRSKRTFGNTRSEIYYKCKECGENFWGRRVLLLNFKPLLIFIFFIVLFFVLWLQWR